MMDCCLFAAKAKSFVEAVRAAWQEIEYARRMI